MLSFVLFAIVMDVTSVGFLRKASEVLTWEVLYANDLLWVAESEEEFMWSIVAWKELHD